MSHSHLAKPDPTVQSSGSEALCSHFNMFWGQISLFNPKHIHNPHPRTPLKLLTRKDGSFV